MGSVDGVDGRINFIDIGQLEELIFQLREKVIKKIAKVRFHNDLAMDAEKRLKGAEKLLSEELRKEILRQLSCSRHHYQLAITADKRLKEAEDRLSELRFEFKRYD